MERHRVIVMVGLTAMCFAVLEGDENQEFRKFKFVSGKQPLQFIIHKIDPTRRFSKLGDFFYPPNVSFSMKYRSLQDY